MKCLAAVSAVAVCLSVVSMTATATADAAGCPNEALRIGPSALLPGCRAYEMVSPVDKNGGSVSNGIVVRTDGSGDAVSYYSTSVFAGNQSSLLASGYVSRRADGAWGTAGVEGPQYNEYGFAEYASPAISEDASKTLQASRLALAPGAIEGGSNLYVRDNATGTYTLVAALPGASFWEFDVGYAKGIYADGTPDWSSMLLSAPFKLTPDATEFGNSSNSNLYEFSGGRLRLADILPNGEPDPEGGHGIAAGHAMSTDGSRSVFVGGPASGGPLYVRIDGERTVAVSASQRPADKGAVLTVTPLYANADDSLIFFETPQEMIPGDETGGTSTIYRYDVDTGVLTDAIPAKPAEGAKVRGLVAAGEDGTLMFRSEAGLIPGVAPTEGGNQNIYVTRGGRLEFVGVSEDPSTIVGAASPDGRYFAFETTTPMRPAEDPPSPACGPSERCRDVYVFDAETEELRCASCVAAPGTAAGNSSLVNEARSPSGPKRVNSVLDDGSVFFQTPNALSPRDVNGVGDVYVWNGGTVGLVSTGTSAQPSTFANATPDGSSVFFTTAQSLVPQDRDDSIDLYADRELGGLAAQYPTGAIRPCEGDLCRGASPSPPAPNPAGSAAGGGESSCLAPAAAARRATEKTGDLTRAAKHAAKGGDDRHARSLRHRASLERRRAKGLRRTAGTCRRAGR